MRILYKYLLLLPCASLLIHGVGEPIAPKNYSHFSPTSTPWKDPAETTAPKTPIIPSVEVPPATSEELEEILSTQSMNQSDEIKTIIFLQLDAIHDRDFSKAYYAYTSLDFQKKTSLDAFRIYMKKNLALVLPHSFEIQEIKFSGVIATVKGSIEVRSKQRVLIQYDLIQENGIWKIRKMSLFSSPAQPEAHSPSPLNLKGSR